MPLPISCAAKQKDIQKGYGILPALSAHRLYGIKEAAYDSLQERGRRLRGAPLHKTADWLKKQITRAETTPNWTGILPNFPAITPGNKALTEAAGGSLFGVTAHTLLIKDSNFAGLIGLGTSNTAGAWWVSPQLRESLQVGINVSFRIPAASGGGFQISPRLQTAIKRFENDKAATIPANEVLGMGATLVALEEEPVELSRQLISTRAPIRLTNVALQGNELVVQGVMSEMGKLGYGPGAGGGLSVGGVHARELGVLTNEGLQALAGNLGMNVHAIGMLEELASERKLPDLLNGLFNELVLQGYAKDEETGKLVEQTVSQAVQKQGMSKETYEGLIERLGGHGIKSRLELVKVPTMNLLKAVGFTEQLAGDLIKAAKLPENQEVMRIAAELSRSSEHSFYTAKGFQLYDTSWYESEIAKVGAEVRQKWRKRRKLLPEREAYAHRKYLEAHPELTRKQQQRLRGLRLWKKLAKEGMLKKLR